MGILSIFGKKDTNNKENLVKQVAPKKESPAGEPQEIEKESIKEDIKWLGFDWDELHNASDYFPKMYECAVKLIKDGKAYVSDLTADEISAVETKVLAVLEKKFAASLRK